MNISWLPNTYISQENPRLPNQTLRNGRILEREREREREREEILVDLSNGAIEEDNGGVVESFQSILHDDILTVKKKGERESGGVGD